VTTLICTHCDSFNVVGETPVIVTEPDGDHTCLHCGHHWRPRNLAYLATEKLLATLAKELK
jgi:hypothetical protein